MTLATPSYAWDFDLKFIFTKAHTPAKMNTAADFLSGLELDANEQILL